TSNSRRMRPGGKSGSGRSRVGAHQVDAPAPMNHRVQSQSRGSGMAKKVDAPQQPGPRGRGQHASAAVQPPAPPIEPTVTPTGTTLAMPPAAITILNLLDDGFIPKRLVRTKRGSCSSRLATDKHATQHQHPSSNNTSGHHDRLLSDCVWIPSCQVVSIQATEPTVNGDGGGRRRARVRTHLGLAINAPFVHDRSDQHASRRGQKLTVRGAAGSRAEIWTPGGLTCRIALMKQRKQPSCWSGRLTTRSKNCI